MKKSLKGLMVGLLMLCVSGMAQATTYDSFGQFDAYTGGGTGIPNDAVATTSYSIPGVTGKDFTIGLTATPRYTNPLLTNDGAGTFMATPGANGSPTLGATWNFGFFVGIDQGYANWSEVVADATSFGAEIVVDLSYDIDPGVGVNYGVFHMGKVITDYAAFLGADPYQGSENLLFSWLYSGSPYVDIPTGVFDPNVAGTYNFMLESSLDFANGSPTIDLGLVSIDVNVAPVPEPATMALFGLGLLGLAGVNRRKK